LRAEFVGRDKGILVWPNIVIAVRPIVNATAPIEARLGRQRGPADIILARSPRDPGRRPFIARHPDPANATQPQPATVVVSRPPKRLLGNPRPAGVAINPAAFGIGPPIAGLFCLTRLPDVTVIARFAPLAVGIELLIKHPVSSRGSFFRPGFGSFVNNRPPWRGNRRFGACRCCRRRFAISDRFFSRVKISLILRETLFLGFHSLRGQTVLHLALDLRFSFLFSLLFLTGNKKRQGSDQRENGKLLHSGLDTDNAGLFDEIVRPISRPGTEMLREGRERS
jgi:hypothetical protein